MKQGRIQAKDIPERPVLEWLARQTEWATHWDPLPGGMPSVTEAMPPDVPEKVRRAKMAALMRRGLVDGCDCGCRGDWQITEIGRALVNKWVRESVPTLLETCHESHATS